MEKKTLTMEELEGMIDLATVKLIQDHPSLILQPELLVTLTSEIIASYCKERGYDLPFDEMVDRLTEALTEEGDIEINIVD